MLLMQGDCLELLKQISDKSIDLVLCDPPYGTTNCKWDSVIPFNALWKELNRISKETTPIVLFGTEPFSSALRMSNIKDFKYDWVWEKEKGSGFLNAKKQPLRKHELVSVFYRKQCIYHPQMKTGVPYTAHNNPSKNKGIHNEYKVVKTENKGNRYPTSIIQYKKSVGYHPAQKPVDLLEYLIKTYTDECNTVLDFAMGSGSTGVACINTNRNFIGIELDETYFKIAEQRIQDALHTKEMRNECS